MALCAECSYDAEEDDYLCRACRRSLLPTCVHLQRRKAAPWPTPSHYEMNITMAGIIKIGPCSQVCECCGGIELLKNDKCLVCLYYEEYPHGPADYASHGFEYNHGIQIPRCRTSNV